MKKFACLCLPVLLTTAACSGPPPVCDTTDTECNALASLVLYILKNTDNACLAGNQNTVASAVYGQFGDFTVATANNGGVSADSLSGPYDVATDLNNGLYVVGSNNNRALYFPSGSTTATRVYGQSGDFTTNAGTVTADGLSTPFGIDYDSVNDILYISDRASSRAVSYPGASTTATGVYGQLGSFVSGGGNNGGLTANALNIPGKLTLDSASGLYIADGNNNRVLYYALGSTTASRVYGQFGDFTMGTANNGGISADSLSGPEGVVVDSNSGVYISDRLNNRILYYPSGSTTATRVYGQAGGFTTNTANLGGISADSLNLPSSLALDAGNNLWVADAQNNRVLFYPEGVTTATVVYGQSGDFTSNAANLGGISAGSLFAPQGVHVSCLGDVYISESSNHRVVKFTP